MGKSKITLFAEIATLLGLAVTLYVTFGIGAGSGNSAVDAATADKIKTLIADYYAVVERHDFSAAAHFYDFPVDKYYSKRNYFADDVKREWDQYYAVWRETRLKLSLSGMQVSKNAAGLYEAVFDFDYYNRKSQFERWTYYRMRGYITLTPEFKIKNIWDEIIDKRMGVEVVPW